MKEYFIDYEVYTGNGKLHSGGNRVYKFDDNKSAGDMYNIIHDEIKDKYPEGYQIRFRQFNRL